MYVYENVSRVIFDDSSSGVNKFAAETIDKFVTPKLNNWHENISASPIGSLIYEYNPLNGVFEEIVGNIFNK